MARSSVTITYECQGTTPPIFVAGSFTEPAWQPVELDHQKVDKEYIFSKAFEITPGLHQYKFRVGQGDWWVCDDTKDREVDGAGNVNNVMTVESSGTSMPGQRRELSEDDQGAEPSTKTVSEHQRSPSLGLDGVDDSDEELARSLRKEVALAENNMAEFHGANGDIEPDDPGTKRARRDESQARVSLASPTSQLVATPEQVPLPDEGPASANSSRNLSATSKVSAPTNKLAADKLTTTKGGGEKVFPQKPSVSTVSARTGQKDQADFWLIRLCRVVVRGVVGSMSTLLCGKRRK